MTVTLDRPVLATPEWPDGRIPVVATFLAAARVAPDRPAVAGPDGVLGYAELDDRTDRVAGLLAGLGVRPGQAVGVFLPRSVDLVVAILGILKAGAVYVPFDPEQPARRLTAIAEDGAVETVLSHSALLSAFPSAVGASVLALDTVDWAAVAPAAPVPVGPRHPAYVIFTSGSTGRPKGVQVSHGALAALLAGLEQAGVYRAPGLRVGWNASVSFDASVQQWLRALRGDTVVVIDEETRRDVEAFARFVADRELDEFDLTPSHLQVLLPELTEVARAHRPGLRLLVGGEAVPPALWAELGSLADEGVLHAVNLYGPTETTVDVLTTPVVSGREPHLGAPLPGTGVRVLDERLAEVPDGEVGELFVTGEQLALGYVGRPGLTSSRFVPDPYAADGSRMYRTGDRVSRAADGTVSYRGRADNQVKVRGYRVELGEIEGVLSGSPAVAAVVVLHRDGQLHAFVEPAAGTGSDAPVRDWAERHLASWMRPSGWTLLPALPRNVAGKADRAALAALWPAEEAAAPTAEEPAEDTGPAGRIAAAWRELLKVDAIADEDDFFCLGGHSLIAMQVAARLRTELGVKVPTRLVMQHRTLAAFTAAVIERIAAA
ncbi:non-ribosomal peptide synthetase [Kitasatospora sp. NPDC048365]|uniref:non-ribosomal peptide synthetase n=1 Tax=Kitasatospora sp. NPDC048365 TaxID=3364050 RepID=UPI003714D1BB